MALIAIQERQMRIEVGLGLEGVLTDAMSNRIIRNEVAPFFREENYEGGIQAGVDAIIKTIAGTYQNENPVPQRKRSKRSPLGSIIFIIIMLIVMSRKNKGGRGADGYFPCAGTAERGLPQAPQIAQIPHPGCPRSRAQKIRKTESKKELPVQQALMLPVFFSPSS